MASQKQIQANRLNAQKSTGPRTPEGKATCSFNALRGGLHASTVILPSENKEDFDSFCAGLMEYYQPANDRELDLVDQLASVRWKIKRAEVLEAGLLLETGNAPARQAIQDFDRIIRVQSRLRREMKEMYKELDEIRAQRLAADPQTPLQQPAAPSAPAPDPPSHPDPAPAPSLPASENPAKPNGLPPVAPVSDDPGRAG